MATDYKPVTHVIFDMDGLLLDTEQRYFRITQEILSRYDKTYTWEVKVQIMGSGPMQIAEKLVEIYELPISAQEYLDIHLELCNKYMKEAQLMPGAERLLRHLTSSNILCALGTSSPQDLMEVKTTNHREVFSLFNHKVCGASDPDVKLSKPAPDIFLVAAERFPDKPAVDKILVFEDAPNGVQAAVSAGMQVVMVPDKRVSDEDRTPATLVLESLEDFVPEQFGLPPYPAGAAAADKPNASGKPGAPTSPAAALEACKKKQDITCCCDVKE